MPRPAPLQPHGMGLRGLRERYGEGRMALAYHIGINVRTLEAYERGDRGIGIRTLKAIADHYGLSLDEAYQEIYGALQPNIV